eukprot:2161653-Pleurochrysis_carterae.AAC.1
MTLFIGTFVILHDPLISPQLNAATMAVVGYARIAAPPPALHCLLILVAATEAAAWGTVYPPLAPLSHATIAQRVNLVHRGQHVPALRSLSMRAPPLRVHAPKMGINPTEYLQDNGQECNASGGSMVSWRRELIKAVLALPLLPVSESFAAGIAAPSAGMIPGRTATNSEAPKAPKVGDTARACLHEVLDQGLTRLFCFRACFTISCVSAAGIR